MQRALITGASGFVGGHLLRVLQKHGWSVHAVLRRPVDLPADVNIHVYDGSTKALAAIVAAARPQVVFHLASAVVGEHTAADLLPLLQGNVVFGTQLLDAMAAQGVRRFVNTGTYWQHYEGAYYAPVNLYAASKQAFEALIDFYVQARGFDAITLKLFDTYGPDDSRPKLLSLLRRAQESEVSLKLSPGGQCVDMVHVDDVCNAYVVAAERLLGRERSSHERYAVRSGETLPLRDVVGLFERVSGRPVPVVWGGRPYRPREMMSPLCPDAVLPGWAARIGLEAGLQSMPAVG